MTPDYFQWLAHYNRWANERLYDAMRALPPDRYLRDCGMFFGSLHGTLNHLLVGDRIWLDRVTRAPGVGYQLSDRPFDNLGSLARARVEEDRRLIRVTETATQDSLIATLRYRNTAGETSSQPLWQILAHLFNHHTHHRGQCHDVLTRIGAQAPPLDIIYFVRDS